MSMLHMLEQTGIIEWHVLADPAKGMKHKQCIIKDAIYAIFSSQHSRKILWYVFLKRIGALIC